MRRIVLSLSFICLCCSLLVGQNKLLGDNYLSSSQFYSITFNGISFKQLEDAKAKESVIKELSKGQFRAVRSDYEYYDWVNYYLFDSISQVLVGYTENGPEDKLELSHIILEGPKAVMNIMGVDLSLGDSILKLGSIKTAKTTTGNEHFALFMLEGSNCCPVYIDFDPETKKIIRMGFYVPT